MNHAAETAMFWTGAMFAFTPILVGGAVVGFLWWKRKRDGSKREGAERTRKAVSAARGLS